MGGGGTTRGPGTSNGTGALPSQGDALREHGLGGEPTRGVAGGATDGSLVVGGAYGQDVAELCGAERHHRLLPQSGASHHGCGGGACVCRLRSRRLHQVRRLRRLLDALPVRGVARARPAQPRGDGHTPWAGHLLLALLRGAHAQLRGALRADPAGERAGAGALRLLDAADRQQRAAGHSLRGRPCVALRSQLHAPRDPALLLLVPLQLSARRDQSALRPAALRLDAGSGADAGGAGSIRPAFLPASRLVPARLRLLES
mmetsp:Transcript_18662/g.55922  ORF Transcript_18662/g.55922 Transcript_18662/m.55922 type:complete len:259 (+) Transcript_18662:95-871(+)